MSKQNNQYQAYSIATRTVGKTRQIVLLYDGAIRFIKQAQLAIAEKRIEDRFKRLKLAAEVIIGLQTSLDFEHGGEVAETLNRFYTNMHVRIMSVNFHRQEGIALCDGIIDDLKRMRDVWDTIDRTMNAPEAENVLSMPAMNDSAASQGTVTLSA